MKTLKNVAKRGLLVMVLALVAMTAIGMTGNQGLSGVKVAQAAKKNAKEVKALEKIRYSWNVTWKKGRVVKLVVNGETNRGNVKKVDLSAFTALTDLTFDAYDLPLTELNLSKNKKLENITFGTATTKLKKLNLPKNATKLKSITLYGHALTKLDVSKCTNLETLEVCSGKLKTLKLPKSSKLTTLNISNNNLTSLDVSGLTSLESVSCAKNPVRKVYAKNCPKLNFSDMCSADQGTIFYITDEEVYIAQSDPYGGHSNFYKDNLSYYQ